MISSHIWITSRIFGYPWNPLLPTIESGIEPLNIICVLPHLMEGVQQASCWLWYVKMWWEKLRKCSWIVIKKNFSLRFVRYISFHQNPNAIDFKKSSTFDRYHTWIDWVLRTNACKVYADGDCSATTGSALFFASTYVQGKDTYIRPCRYFL